ncbi:MAG: hypothetical protein ACXVMS_06335 [Flavisolibacter sp.]
MKGMILWLGASLTFGCTAEKTIQTDMMDVQLVKIETVQRYPGLEQKLLTWRDRNHVDYITYEPLSADYKIGSFMKALIRR